MNPTINSYQVKMVSTVRFPTEKAYGVTITGTINALEKAGHQVEIISPATLKLEEMQQPKAMILNFFRNFFSPKNQRKLFGRFQFLLYRILFGISTGAIDSAPKTIIWLRDPLIALINRKRFKDYLVVVELHQELSWFDLLILERINKYRNVVLAPISRYLELQLREKLSNFQNFEIVMAPMGVPDNFLSHQIITRSNSQGAPLLGGYIGGFLSNGIDQNLMETLVCLKSYNEKSDKVRIKLKLVGVEQEYLTKVDDLNKVSTEPYLFALPRIPHFKIPDQMDDVDFFILPYPEGKNFQNRFPLKALEYAALRKPILVTRTVSHESIFSDQEVWFVTPNNCESLIATYEEMCKSPALREKKCALAFKLALDHTYDSRVAKVLDAVLKT